MSRGGLKSELQEEIGLARGWFSPGAEPIVSTVTHPLSRFLGPIDARPFLELEIRGAFPRSGQDRPRSRRAVRRKALRRRLFPTMHALVFPAPGSPQGLVCQIGRGLHRFGQRAPLGHIGFVGCLPFSGTAWLCVDRKEENCSGREAEKRPERLTRVDTSLSIRSSSLSGLDAPRLARFGTSFGFLFGASGLDECRHRRTVDSPTT
jgi:hypothetical protein